MFILNIYLINNFYNFLKECNKNIKTFSIYLVNMEKLEKLTTYHKNLKTYLNTLFSLIFEKLINCPL